MIVGGLALATMAFTSFANRRKKTNENNQNNENKQNNGNKSWTVDVERYLYLHLLLSAFFHTDKYVQQYMQKYSKSIYYDYIRFQFSVS